MKRTTKALHAFLTRRIWGPRCPDFEASCVICAHWAEHDWIFSDANRGAPLQHPDHDASLAAAQQDQEQ